jgi:FKBP-type peptidyl-prolyl cis-trans isomerase (trigger factor)
MATKKSSSKSAKPSTAARRVDLQQTRLDAAARETLARKLKSEADGRDVDAALALLPPVGLPDLKRIARPREADLSPVVITRDDVVARARARARALAHRAPKARGEPVSEDDDMTVSVVVFEGGRVKPGASRAAITLTADDAGSLPLRAALALCNVGESRFVMLDSPMAVRVLEAASVDSVPEPDERLLAEAERDALRAARATRLLQLERAVLDRVVDAVDVRVPSDVIDTVLRAWWSEIEAPALEALGVVEETAERAFVDDPVQRDAARLEVAKALVIAAVIRVKKLSVDQSDVDAYAAFLAERLHVTPARVREALLGSSHRLKRIARDLLTERALEVLTREVVGDDVIDALRGKRSAA